MTNPNINCLADMSCPDCGSYGPFVISVYANVTVSDSGVTASSYDSYWDSDNGCTCAACGYDDVCAAFDESRREAA